jgi:sugar lactone lactonase YvrE
MSAQCLFGNLRLHLGEGLHWDPVADCLWFVDILGPAIYRWRPGTDAPQAWAAPQRVGWVLPRRGSNELLAGFQQGVARVQLPPDGSSGPLDWQWLARIHPDGSTLRLNDAKADARGRVWAGSLNHGNESSPDGAWYCMDPVVEPGGDAASAPFRQVDSGYQVANGPAIHPDQRLVLHTDSGRRTIYAFDLDLAQGTVSGRRVWKTFTDDEGYPDGMTWDAEGALWVAHWGAGCISRFAADGRLLRRVALPASHITNVCFGGTALDRLFVTSAWAGLSPAQRQAQPLAGAVFEVDALGVRGLAGLPAG